MWSTISYRLSTEQGKFADQRPTFYLWAMQPPLWFLGHNKCPVLPDTHCYKVTAVKYIPLPVSENQVLASYQSVPIHCSNCSTPLWSRMTTSGAVSARQARLTTRRKSTASRSMTHTSTAHSKQLASINSWNRYLTHHICINLHP